MEKRSGRERKFVGIFFECCRIYQRIYINRSKTGYDGFCPKCGKAVKLKIGEGGVEDRFFTAQ